MIFFHFFTILCLFSNFRALVEHKDIVRIQWNWKVGMCMKKCACYKTLENYNNLGFEWWSFSFSE